MNDVRAVSVIVCTHNRSDRLPKVISLLRAQDYPRDAVEIVVVDNRSSDHTSRVVKQLAAEPGITVRYVYESRSGITFARNRGAEEARHPYLAYIDDDCAVRSDWLRRLMGGFDLHARVVAAGGLVSLKWEQPRPAWLGQELDAWLADTCYLGDQARLLNDDERLVESNTAFERRAWQSAGGFIGMEQFGSRNMAAGEVLYLLHQLRRQGGRVAFVPAAVMEHHVNAPTRRRMLERAYWQGVSDAILKHLLHRRSGFSTAWRAVLDLGALLVLLGWSAATYASGNSAKGMYHLTRAVRRIGFLLSELRLVGDWQSVRTWSPDQNLSRQSGHRIITPRIEPYV
jgi:glycosyltransferase involved in cell wall biosynthesis